LHPAGYITYLHLGGFFCIRPDILHICTWGVFFASGRIYGRFHVYTNNVGPAGYITYLIYYISAPGGVFLPPAGYMADSMCIPNICYISGHRPDILHICTWGGFFASGRIYGRFHVYTNNVGPYYYISALGGQPASGQIYSRFHVYTNNIHPY
jgi:hypothetical protein